MEYNDEIAFRNYERLHGIIYFCLDYFLQSGYRYKVPLLDLAPETVKRFLVWTPQISIINTIDSGYSTTKTGLRVRKLTYEEFLHIFYSDKSQQIKYRPGYKRCTLETINDALESYCLDWQEL